MNNPLASLSLAWMLSGCTSPYPIPVEQPRPAPWSVAAEKNLRLITLKKSLWFIENYGKGNT